MKFHCQREREQIGPVYEHDESDELGGGGMFGHKLVDSLGDMGNRLAGLYRAQHNIRLFPHIYVFKRCTYTMQRFIECIVYIMLYTGFYMSPFR